MFSKTQQRNVLIIIKVAGSDYDHIFQITKMVANESFDCIFFLIEGLAT